MSLNRRDERAWAAVRLAIAFVATLPSTPTFAQSQSDDFLAFRERFASCLERGDRNCLRELIAPEVQLSFGAEAPGARERAIQNWKLSDLKYMRDLLRKGTEGSGDERGFPPAAGTGQRGGFKRVDGRWRLQYFLSGD